MKQLITKQSDQIEKLQNELNEQKLVFDFTKNEQQRKKEEKSSSPKPPAIIISNKGETNN